MLSAFNEHFSPIPDHRQQSKVELKLHYILLTFVVGMIFGADGRESIEEVAHNKIELFKINVRRYWITDVLSSINIRTPC